MTAEEKKEVEGVILSIRKNILAISYDFAYLNARLAELITVEEDEDGDP